MIKPAFNHEQKSWDKYRAFFTHDSNSGITMFETGEMMLTTSHPHPDRRQTFERYGIQVVATSDSDCPDLFIPDTMEKVPKAHLNDSGQQYLCVDLRTKRAYRLGRDCPVSKLKGPEHTHEASMLWVHPRAEPINHRPIGLLSPDSATRRHIDRSVLNEVTIACQATVRMGLADDVNQRIDDRKLIVPPSWIGLGADCILQQMNDSSKHQVAQNGLGFGRVSSLQEYLVTGEVK